MIERFLGAVTLVVLLSAAAAGQDARTVIANASRAMGVEGLDSITYFGQAANFNLGQSPNANGPWPRLNISDYHRSIDFTASALRSTGVIIGPAGGGNVNVTQRDFSQYISAGNAWAQQLEIWVTPWGFLKGALANNATAERRTVDGQTYDVIAWNAAVQSPSGTPYRVVGYINDRGEVEKVETWVEHVIFGDMLVETNFMHYRDNNGLRYPSTIVQNSGGWPTFEAQIANATANPPNIRDLIQAPAAGGQGAGGQGGQPAAGSERLAEGVYRITGGYVALAVEFSDHVVVLEAGQNEARGVAIIEETRRVFPSKPIRYVVNTHHHFDHSSGLPPFVAEGITIITHELNRPLFERAFAAPRTLAPDRLARSGQTAKFETVEGDLKVLEDATRRLELHHIKGNYHADGMLVAYLPREKILFQADFSLPAPDQEANPFVRALADNLDRLQLDFDWYVPVHPPNPDRMLTRQDFDTALGRRSGE